ncbi:MAG: glutamine synthetase family protein [Bacteroidota bacterium]|nr:glutamine synthetase family protein [Bacteroidota bacterium]MDP4247246.1 glutamine synthetase family protein [Bacteroidota bacterium]MDP4259463.1 glutamine synthetase family protein [Bacteroidota bacterium]
MPNKQSLPDLLRNLGKLGTEKVKLAITDVDGILRGKVVSFDKFRSVAGKGFGFCDVVFGWDSGDQAYDNASFTGWHTGYPDADAVVDIDTFRQVPWEDGMPFFLADFRAKDGATLPVCPRGLLKKIVAQASELGVHPVFSQEFEWYNFVKPAGDSPSSLKELQPISPGMFGYSILRASQGSAYFNDLFDQLRKFGVPLEGLHTETGPGVYEAAILYADVLEAADRAVLFKTGVKEIAGRHGILPTFMAKITENLPGCSGHVHQSLWSADGSRNLFFDEQDDTQMSGLMESYMAGQLACLPYLLPMYAPTINSYKRLVEGAWAPTTLTWGIDNRTTALRAMPGGANSTRLETRVVGSDANPYLAMAGCLASGLYGVRNQLTLTTPATIGNGYADKKNGILPRNLWEATQAMRQSPLAKELFGEAFVDHFTGTREWEWRQYARSVTDWEFKRYLEII